MALPITDTWSQSSGSTQQIAVYGAYALLEGSMQIISGSPGIEITGGTYNTARRTDETPAVAQYSEVLLTAGQISTGVYCGPAVRCQSGANSSYHVETNGSNFYLSKCLAGVQTTLAGPVTLSSSGAAGDVFRLEIEEITGTTTLRVYFKGVLQGTYTDTSSPITTAGFLGVFGYGNTTGTRVIGTWTAGNLAAPPSASLLYQGKSVRLARLLHF